MNLENEVVREFAVQIERNSTAIRSLKRSNGILSFVTLIFGAGLAITGTELYLYEKREDERWRKEKNPKKHDD